MQWPNDQLIIIIIIIIIIISSKKFQKISNNIPVKHEIKKLLKTAILGTAHILRIVPM